jgi:hypothetical protein
VHRIFGLVCFVVLICSCSTEESEEKNQAIDKTFLTDSKLSGKEKLQKALAFPYLKSLGMNEAQQQAVNTFYEANSFNFQLFKGDSLTRLGQKAYDCMNEPLQFGIPRNRILPLQESHHWIENELILACNLLTAAGILKNGLLDYENKLTKPTIPLDGKEFHLQLKQLDTISLAKLLIKQGPTDTNYRFIADHLYDYCQRVSIDTHQFVLKSKKEDTLNFEKNIRECLIQKGFLTNKSSKQEFNSAIKQFKKLSGFNEDNRIDEATIQALNESTLNKVKRIALALDKLRQPRKTDKKYVIVNLPSFELFFYADDTLRSRNRIIIGKTTNQTPQLKASINRIVCHPFWKVPQSIADKEILPAVKANSRYLSTNHYRIYRGKNEINPTTVNWKRYKKNFPYTVIQDPGPHNSLGIIKLEFYNSFSVYVHDTPTKSLFRRGYRSFSHGCMRCENPVELAKTILDFDSISPRNRNVYTRDSIDSILYRAVNFSIPLKRSIPIYVEYITVSATRDNLFLHLDLYKRDDEYLNLMFGS